MCLIVDKTKPIPRKNFKVWKVFRNENGRIYTPVQLSEVPITGGIFKALNPLDSKTSNLSNGTRIDGGAIHACITQDSFTAESWLSDHKNNFIVECEVKRDDFIAWGKNNEDKSYNSQSGGKKIYPK